jgi:AcrR family transcriptional regulator
MTSARESLIEAMYSLLEESDIDAITVEDVLRKSGVSRGTFYRHFRDKYDVASSFFTRFLGGLETAGGRPHVESSTLTLSFMKRHRRFFTNALRGVGQNSFSESMSGVMRDIYSAAILKKRNGGFLSWEENVAVRYAVAGELDIIRSWVDSGMDTPPDELARTLASCLPAAVREWL